MKILLTTLNAKYVHTPLALWYLYQYCRKEHPGLMVREFNINQDLNWVCGEIFLEKADVVAFSCNIWNIEPILKIVRRLKTVAPETAIILGGPEVSADPLQIMTEHPEIDFIVIGEGEDIFREWLAEFPKDAPVWDGIAGLVYRTSGNPVRAALRPRMKDLSRIPFPYPDQLADIRQKMVYYESSRGCPNHCQYCLSANEYGVRFFPLDRVKRELLLLIEAEIGQVKFVDRTFNCDPARAREIWRFLIDHYPHAEGKTNFHFEIMGELLDDESLDLLAQAPEGLFQFEIGVQSTNPETLTLIQRRMDFHSLKTRVQKLIARGNIIVHLDLIAGLPAEDYPTFSRTVDENLRLAPHRLQLGFLKLLKGSGLRRDAARYDYRFTAEPPYEVIGNRWIDYQDLLKLKTIEDLLDKYFNSGWFRLSVPFLFAQYPAPFSFFETMAAWWKIQGFDRISHKGRDLYDHLMRFVEALFPEQTSVFANLLKFDLLSRERVTELPDWAARAGLETEPEVRQLGYRFWLTPDNRDRFIPEFSMLAPREISRRVIFTHFSFDPLLNAAQTSRLMESDPVLYLFVYHANNKVKFFNIGNLNLIGKE